MSHQSIPAAGQLGLASALLRLPAMVPLRAAVLLPAAVLLSAPVMAHPIHGTGHEAAAMSSAAGWLSGFLHPLTGVDHLLAMLALGLWAGQLGRPAIWLLPAIFPAFMAIGAALAMSGIPATAAAGSAAELVILLSLVALGAAVTLRVRMPALACGLVGGLFGLAHGFAHGAELPATASPVVYAAGFLIATVLLHLAGVAAGATLGAATAGRRSRWVVQAGGTAIAASGMGMFLL